WCPPLPSSAGDGSCSGLHSVHKRKHKKHKKHKRKHHSFAEAPEPEPVRPSPASPSSTLGTKSVPTFTVHPGVACPPSPLMIINNDDDEEPSVPLEQYRAWLDEDSNLATSPLPDMDSDSMLCPPADEEERWLDALEKGELDDNGELKKEIDESLLTARQKALLHKQQSQPLLELPMGYKEKEMTVEMMQKREERAHKRRLQAAKKAEENKNQTIERLTKTSKAKIKSMRERKSRLSQCLMVRYSDSVRGMAISFPAGVPAPAPAAPPRPPAAPSSCGVGGCTNRKIYSCSKTGVPLCSLECYKTNLNLRRSGEITGPGRRRV
uniref:INO80 complex subunit B n=1 Tax=Scophthalmus maximus TaxID=52904 RepID=A0A8D3AT46_SCOMX